MTREASDNDTAEPNDSGDVVGFEKIRSQLEAPDETTQYAGAERLTNIAEENPKRVVDHTDLVKRVLLSNHSRVRNEGMRTVLILVNYDPSAGRNLIEPAIEALGRPAAPWAKNEVIKALSSVHRNTEASISDGDKTYADLISTADKLVVDRVVEYIGGAVMDEPESFPATRNAMVEALDAVDKDIVTNAAIVLGVIARDAPELLPKPETTAEKLEEVRDRDLLRDERPTIEKSIQFVRDVATNDGSEVEGG